MSATKIKVSESRHAVVMGGARGIGEAIVRCLAADGFAVTIADRLEAEAAALSRRLQAEGFTTFATGVDITNRADLEALAATMKERAGSRGVLAAVNSVGVFDERATVLNTSVDSFQRLLNVNVLGAFSFSQTIAPALGKDASIVHIGSVNGKLAGAELGCYKVTKAAMHMLARCLAMELARDARRIRVNVVAPGWVDTPGERVIHQTAPGQIHPLDDPANTTWIPLQRRTEAHEIGDTVAYLCSHRSSAITGQIFYVDCGITVRSPQEV